MKLIIELSVDRQEIIEPNVLEKLYKLSYEDSNTESLLDSSSDVRGSITTRAAYEDSVLYLRNRFPNLNITVIDNYYYIRFEDPEVERISVETWGSNLGISKGELSAILDLNYTFKGNTSIEKFNELLYFGVNLFLGHWKDGGLFLDCTNLKEVTLPKRSISLESRVFMNCSNLEKINNIEYVSSIGFNTFSECVKLYKNDVLNLPLSIELTGNSIFRLCTFALLYIPKLLHTSSGLGYSNLWSNAALFGGERNGKFNCLLMYFRDLLKIYCASFCMITGSALVINNETPPVWANQNDKTDEEAQSDNSYGSKLNMFVDSTIGGASLPSVYVPDNAVTTYQNHELWGTYCNILPISSLNNGVTYQTYQDWLNAGKPVALIEEYM